MAEKYERRTKRKFKIQNSKLEKCFNYGEFAAIEIDLS